MRFSLSWKWVLVSILIECFMLTLLVIKNVGQLEDNLSAQTYTRLNEQKILLKSALLAPVIQMDYATIDAILEETKIIETIDYLFVVDNENRIISSMGWKDTNTFPKTEDDPFSKEALEDGRFDTTIDIVLDSQKLGKIYVGLSTKFYIQAREDMISRSILIAIIELVLSVLLLITASKWIIKNLTKLTHTANSISLGDYSQRINLGDSKETFELQNSFNLMASNIQKNIDNLESVNKKLNIQLEKNHEQDLLLKHQTRMAILGEMLNNIAHQWRQPLNGITVQISSLKLKSEVNILEKEDINKATDSIMNYANYLSQTIDDFRNFMKNTGKKENFYIKNTFDKALGIVSSSLENNNINLIFNKDNENFCINGVENELVQVIINILNNSKDILIEKNIKKKFIEISSYNEKDKKIITIHDNAGGVNEKIIDKIFDPYFTTKHSSRGTGIGLYMSAKIINKHFFGEIIVKNEDLIVDNIKYTGAKFYIILFAK